jgi:UDP-2,3-diacylglucosamine hydrolase
MKIFISDVHLGYYSQLKNREIEDKLIQLLRSNIDECTGLFLVGDIFDYWFDYKEVIPKQFYRIITALDEYRLKNIPITYVMGNHDFGHYKFFKEFLDIEVIEEDLEMEMDGYKFYITHGDGKNINDYGYRILKSVLRNKLCRFLYRWIHPDLGIKLASGSSKESRKHSSNSHSNEYSDILEFAEIKITEGFDYVVMGHTHKQEIKKIASGYYVNIGEWLKEPSYSIWDGENFYNKKI